MCPCRVQGQGWGLGNKQGQGRTGTQEGGQGVVYIFHGFCQDRDAGRE